MRLAVNNTDNGHKRRPGKGQQENADQTDSEAALEQQHNGKRHRRAGRSHRRGDDTTEGDYLVGYRKPPSESRFQEGNQAARGRGRPKGSRNRATVVKELADFKHTVTMPDGKSRTMTLWEAGVWKLGIAAANGNIKALALLTELYDRFGVALPDAPVLAEPLTQDEDAGLRQLLIDWAMENPDEACAVLAGLKEGQKLSRARREGGSQEAGGTS